jgi:hypothetical protein
LVPEIALPESQKLHLWGTSVAKSGRDRPGMGSDEWRGERITDHKRKSNLAVFHPELVPFAKAL